MALRRDKFGSGPLPEGFKYFGIEAGREALANDISWREWEKEIEGYLDAGEWHWWHVSRMPTRELNKRFRAGLPDYVAVGMKGKPTEGRGVVVEAKTGKGRLSKKQEEVLGAWTIIPGFEGGVFRPEDRGKLRLLLGVM